MINVFYLHYFLLSKKRSLCRPPFNTPLDFYISPVFCVFCFCRTKLWNGSDLRHFHYRIL